MPVAEHKATVRRFVDAVNTQSYEVFDEILTEDFSIPPGGDAGLSRDALKAVLAYYFTAFPDLRYEIVDLIGEDDSLVAHLSMRGTHKGDYQGHGPSGKAFAVDEVDLMRFRDGKIAGYRIVWDEASFRSQLGLA
jgi:hypothetical protein